MFNSKTRRKNHNLKAIVVGVLVAALMGSYIVPAQFTFADEGAEPIEVVADVPSNDVDAGSTEETGITEETGGESTGSGEETGSVEDTSGIDTEEGETGNVDPEAGVDTENGEEEEIITEDEELLESDDIIFAPVEVLQVIIDTEGTEEAVLYNTDTYEEEIEAETFVDVDDLTDEGLLNDGYELVNILINNEIVEEDITDDYKFFVPTAGLSIEFQYALASPLVETFIVTFKSGEGSANDDIVYEGLTAIPAGTPILDIAPTFSPIPGFKFTGWDKTGNVTGNMTITALWAPVATPHDWKNALKNMSWTIPGDAMRLTFNNVSLNGHTYLDYVYIRIDDNGNAYLYFLAWTDNKRFEDEDSQSFMDYAGIRGKIVVKYN